MLDRVLERQDTSLGLCLVADVGVLLPHADHDAGVARPADDAREDGPRRIVAGESRLQFDTDGWVFGSVKRYNRQTNRKRSHAN
jgi:hypothetical protein